MSYPLSPTSTVNTGNSTTQSAPAYDPCCFGESFRSVAPSLHDFGSGEYSYDATDMAPVALSPDSAAEARRKAESETTTSSNSSSGVSVSINTNLNSPNARNARTLNQRQPTHYSVTELVKTLGHEKDATQLPPELTRRVLDFRMATLKRREKYGDENKWGIFGLYSHLSNVRIDLEWAEDAAWRRRHGRPYLSWTDFDAQRNKGNMNRPWFTYFLIVVCTIMLIVEFGLGGWVMEPLKVNPMLGPSAQAMIDAGARVTPLIVEQGQWFRIISPLFLHAGIIHWGINMLALWFIGAAVERTHGILNTIILFFVPGIGGCILSAIFLPHYISVGASGGIFGLVGGCIADIALNWNLLFLKTGANDKNTKRQNFVAFAMLLLDIVINTIIGFTPYIDNFQHLGGLFYGICCGLSTFDPIAVGFFGVQMPTFERVRAMIRRFLGLIISIVLIIVTASLLATMNLSQTPCSACRYISCVPFPFWSQHKWWYCDDCNYVSATLYMQNGTYSSVDLTCPDGTPEMIPLNGQFTNEATIQQQLPTFCRQYCHNTM